MVIGRSYRKDNKINFVTSKHIFIKSDYDTIVEICGGFYPGIRMYRASNTKNNKNFIGLTNNEVEYLIKILHDFMSSDYQTFRDSAYEDFSIKFLTKRNELIVVSKVQKDGSIAINSYKNVKQYLKAIKKNKNNLKISYYQVDILIDSKDFQDLIKEIENLESFLVVYKTLKN